MHFMSTCTKTNVKKCPTSFFKSMHICGKNTKHVTNFDTTFCTTHECTTLQHILITRIYTHLQLGTRHKRGLSWPQNVKSMHIYGKNIKHALIVQTLYLCKVCIFVDKTTNNTLFRVANLFTCLRTFVPHTCSRASAHTFYITYTRASAHASSLQTSCSTYYIHIHVLYALRTCIRMTNMLVLHMTHTYVLYY